MPAKPRHFLLVEDDDAHAELVLLGLGESPLANTVDRVADGAAALAYVRREGKYAQSPRPDVILLDLRLPKVDGHQVLAALKSDEDLRAIPVVVLSTSATEADKAEAYSNHANSYLVKPLNFEKFQQMIRDLTFYWTAWNEPCVEAAP
ncbi:MAG: response regulator [Planctomycetota bacterium]